MNTTDQPTIFTININASNFITAGVHMANTKCTFIIDCGADVSLFKVDKINPMQKVDTANKTPLTGITNGTVSTLATTVTDLYYDNGLSIRHTFHLVPNTFPIATDGILGRDFLMNNKCIIDYETWLLHFNLGNVQISIPIEDTIHDGFTLPNRSEVVRKISDLRICEDMVVLSQEILPGVFCGNTIISPNMPFIKFINTTDSPVHVANNTFKPILEPLKDYCVMAFTKDNQKKEDRIQEILRELDVNNLPSKARLDFINLIKNYADIFCLISEKLTVNNFYTQNIFLNDSVPTYIPNYKTIHAQGEEIQSQIRKMLNDKIIEPSVSPYNSPILLVPKKSGDGEKKWRLVVDFRQLNKKILADKFPLPRIDTILDQLGRAKYFTTLDLMSGFHQIALDRESRKFTAFSTQSGHYQFARLPFGLNISPNSFQRMMTIAMAGLSPEVAFVYIDDIVVIGCSIKHHLSNLTKVFDRLRQYNLKLNVQKCKFFRSEVTYLGHNITDKGILPDSSKFEAIKNYPTPKNADEVRRFVAFCNYYRKFVPHFASIAHQLNQLLTKKAQFIWTTDCQSAFDNLRKYLMCPTILQYPDFSKEFILTTDASDVGCGAVLSQISEGNDLPIAFASKSFTQGEKNKAVILKELTAIHWAIDYFKAYLYGRKFKVRTDHRPLVFLFGMKNPTSKLTRMRLDLEEYDFVVEYIKGKNNTGADALSRIVITSDELKSDNILVVNTRSITQKQRNIRQQDGNIPNNTLSEQSQELDHLPTYVTENPSETNKLWKLQVFIKDKIWTFMLKKNKKENIVAQIQQRTENGSQIFEFALSIIEKHVKQLKKDKIAISLENEIFTYIPLNLFRMVVINTARSM